MGARVLAGPALRQVDAVRCPLDLLRSWFCGTSAGDKLSFMGVAPYYMFQCRPTEGNRFFTLGVEEASRIFEEARLRSSGLAKRARLVMSHASGKIEILGTHAGQTFFRHQRAADPEDEGRFLIFPSNPEATWFDDYVGAATEL